MQSDTLKKALLSPAAGATVVLGLVGAALWDFLVKPGVTSIWGTVLSALTLGSATIRDSVYTSAALDPTPLPAIVLLLAAAVVPMAAHGYLTGRIRRKLRDRRLRDMPSQETEAQVAKRRLDSRWMLFAAWLYLSIVGLVFVVAALQVSNSIAVWRQFHANLRICAPALSLQERDVLLARFTMMKGKGDFDAIKATMNSLACQARLQW